MGIIIIQDRERLICQIEHMMLAFYQQLDADPEHISLQINLLRSKLICMDPGRMERFDQMRQTMMVLQ